MAQPVITRLDRHLAELQRLRRAAALLGPDASDPLQIGADLGITPREMTVLSLLAEGLMAASIARRLGVTPATVAKHQQNLYRKLDVQDRLTAVLAAQHLGVLPRPGALG